MTEVRYQQSDQEPTMRFKCPHCGQVLEIADSRAGRPTSCPACAKELLISTPKPKWPVLAWLSLPMPIIGATVSLFFVPYLADAQHPGWYLGAPVCFLVGLVLGAVVGEVVVICSFLRKEPKGVAFGSLLVNALILTLFVLVWSGILR